MIPARFAPILFGLIVSGLMSFIVSGIATFRAIGWEPEAWMASWTFAWAVAFPTLLVVRPVAVRITARLTAGDAGPPPGPR